MTFEIFLWTWFLSGVVAGIHLFILEVRDLREVTVKDLFLSFLLVCLGYLSLLMAVMCLYVEYVPKIGRIVIWRRRE